MNAKTETLMSQATAEEKAMALQLLIIMERVTEAQAVASLMIAKHALRNSASSLASIA